MKYKFTIKNTKTDEVRVYSDDYDWDDEHNMMFQWFENNYHCDCNRALCFARAAGEDEDDAWETDCGHELYQVLSIEGEDGNLVNFCKYYEDNY
jgi:hypothetical protein